MTPADEVRLVAMSETFMLGLRSMLVHDDPGRQELTDAFEDGITAEEALVVEVRLPIDSSDPRHAAADGLYRKLRQAFSDPK